MASPKDHWKHLRHSVPGERFQQYHAWRREHRGQGVLRLLRLGAGLTLIPVGLVLIPAPGPGIAIVALGACLAAGESRRTARGLDRIELGLRKLLRQLRR